MGYAAALRNTCYHTHRFKQLHHQTFHSVIIGRKKTPEVISTVKVLITNTCEKNLNELDGVLV